MDKSSFPRMPQPGLYIEEHYSLPCLSCSYLDVVNGTEVKSVLHSAALE